MLFISRRDCVYFIGVFLRCILGIVLFIGDVFFVSVINLVYSNFIWVFCFLVVIRRRWYRGAIGRLISFRLVVGSSRVDRVFLGLFWFRVSLMRLSVRIFGEERFR